MTTTRLIRPTLIAGHAALAMIALGAIQFTLPATTMPQWHAAGPLAQSIAQPPRRLPASRRAERTLVE